MRRAGPTQPLAYHLRLPDAAHPQALALLLQARDFINVALVALWPRLEEFRGERTSPAWKHVETMYAWPAGIGNRLGRCLAEQVGRILRTQAARKQLFDVIAPVLHQGMIHPADDKQPKPGKNRWQIRQDLQALTSVTDNGGDYVAFMSLVEQACNYYLKHGQFPQSYEEIQPIPIMEAAQIPYAADDGMAQGQAFQLRLDQDKREALLWLRAPNDDGTWDRHWRDEARATVLKLPDCVVARLQVGEPMAPTLRLVASPDHLDYVVLDFFIETPTHVPPEWATMRRVLGFDWGVRTLVTASVLESGEEDAAYRQVSRPFFLDTGLFDGAQARTRRQIDQLKACIERLKLKREALPETDVRRGFYDQKIAPYEVEKKRCWKKYQQRNRALAHLAANVLILLAWVFDCELIVGESLKTLKSTGRGKGVKGRWTHWRNNSQIRGEIWRVLHYKCYMVGLRLESQVPNHTSHTCPRCSKPAHTYAAPDRLTTVVEAGHWLYCAACGFHADRDYAASLNIARLGLAWLRQYQRTGRLHRFTITDHSVKSVSYTGTDAALPLPPTTPLSRPSSDGSIFISGWTQSVRFSSSYHRTSLFHVSQASTRQWLFRLKVG